MVAAQQYYIEHGLDLSMDRLVSLLPNYIPDYCLQNGDKSLERWASLVIAACKKVFRFV